MPRIHQLGEVSRMRLADCLATLNRAPHSTLGEEIAVPFLVEVGGGELARRHRRELAHRRTDPHQHHEDQVEAVVPGRDELGRSDLGVGARAAALVFVAAGGGAGAGMERRLVRCAVGCRGSSVG